jgi:hypothetical protein
MDGEIRDVGAKSQNRNCRMRVVFKLSQRWLKSQSLSVMIIVINIEGEGSW